MDARILVVDDEPSMGQMLSHMLQDVGTVVGIATDGAEAMELISKQRPDLVLLDIMMPGIDGFEVCRRVRQVSRVPIILVTALTEHEHIVLGLDAGADDFISKPFKSEVLVARCRAVLRRSEGRFQSKEPEVGYRDHYLMIDLVGRVARADGENVDLSPLEWKVLAQLVSNRGQLLTYQQILESVWGLTAPGHLDYVHVYVSRLRSKLEPESHDPRYLHTVETIGYRFEPSGGLDSSAYVGNEAKRKK